MIPDETVEEVRARAATEIVEIIGEHVQLKKSGKDYKAKCPFHDDRTPSFYVVPSKGFYKCFGCGESGDAFTFVMKKLGLDFVEAVKHVGAKLGVDVKEVTRAAGEEDPYRPFYEANAFANDYFQKTLWSDDLGAEARSYLEGRGIGRETAERFGLGYALDEWRGLRDAAARHDLDDEVLLRVGLLTTSEKAPEPYDRFRNRITFPIESLGEKVLGFGGRVLEGSDEGAPKYLNTPESPIFHKGRVLYGLSWARHAIRKEESALIVEGYMDVVALAARGVENAVAPLGTSVTEEHARLLSRYTSQVFLLFDSDAAGLKATFRAADVLLETGIHPSVATLPPGEDPDTLVRKEGPEGIRRHLAQAVDVLDRKLQILEEHDYFSDIEKTRQAVDRLLPTLRAAADPALRDIYVAKVAERTGVRRKTLEEELSRAERRFAEGAAEAGRGRDRRRPTVPTGTAFVPAGRMGPERQILLLLLHDPEGLWLDRARDALSPEAFRDAAYREIFAALATNPALAQDPSGLTPSAARRLDELLSDPEELSQGESVFQASLRRLRARSLSRREEELDRRITEASSEEEKIELLREKDRIRRERLEIAPDDWSSRTQTWRMEARTERER